MSSAIPRFRVFVARKKMDENRAWRVKDDSGRHYTFVSTLFELLVLGSLINELQDLICERMRMRVWHLEEKKPGYSVGLRPLARPCHEKRDRPLLHTGRKGKVFFVWKNEKTTSRSG